MSGFLPEKLRRLLPALLLSLFLHFLVFGGIGLMMTDWTTPKDKLKSISAHIAANAPVAEEKPAEIMPPPKPVPPPPPPLLSPAPPEPSVETSVISPEVPQIPEEQPTLADDEYAADYPMIDPPPGMPLEGDDDGVNWPDIPGYFEDVREELEADLSEIEIAEQILPDGRIFPWKGEISYKVYRGEQGWEIGTARLEWEFRQRTYRFSTVMRTTGLVGFLYQARIQTESVGIFTGGEFYPLRYKVRADGRADETMLFDWNGRTVRMEGRGRNRELPLRFHSQDLLSLQGQLPFWLVMEEVRQAEAAAEAEAKAEVEVEVEVEAEVDADTDGDMNAGVYASVDVDWQEWAKTVWMATGRGYEVFRITAAGEESLELSGRVLTTVRFRIVGGRAETEFWLARELYWLPVQIRHIDRRGDFYEQRLDSYDFVHLTREEE
ncbi:MAG: DUF3108 domain-containing protein [Betaproteobacteria bacterium]|nr:DUF3108 domain-containing protein [Betaproteobacteria bacterium]